MQWWLLVRSYHPDRFPCMTILTLQCKPHVRLTVMVHSTFHLVFIWFFIYCINHDKCTISWLTPTSDLWPFPCETVPRFLNLKSVRVCWYIFQYWPKSHLVSITWYIFIILLVWIFVKLCFGKNHRKSFRFVSVWSRVLSFSHWASVRFVNIRYFYVFVFVPKQ